MRAFAGKLFKRVNLVTLSFVLAVSSLSALGPVLLSKNVGATSGSVAVYDGIPSVQPSSYVSLGYQATSTKEFGDEIQLAGTNRHLDNVTVSLTDWACENDYTKASPSDPCVSTPNSTFNHPITLNLHNVSGGVVGSLIATKTQTVAVPYRPSADPINCTGANAGKWFDGTNCNNGYAFDVDFDFSSLATMLPDSLVASVAYNTQSYGDAPIGVAGPYNSLNVSLAESDPTLGTDVDSDTMYWDTTWPGYTPGLKADSGWTPYHLAITVNASQIDAPTNLRLQNINGAFACGGVTNINSITPTWDAVPGAASYNYTVTLPDSSVYGPINVGDVTSVTGPFGAEGTSNFSVQAVDAYGAVSDWAPACEVTYDATAPAAPTNGQPALTATNDFYFTWDAVTDSGSPIVEYQFQSSTSNATDGDNSLIGAWRNWVDAVVPEQLTLTTPTIHSVGAPDGLYYWQARAIDAAGNVGAWSNPWNTAIDTTAPAVPTLTFPADNVYRHSADTNHSDWSAVTDPSGPVTYYYQSAYDAAFTSIAYTSGALSDTTILNPGEPEVTYYWRVMACDALGNCSAWSSYRTINIDNTTPVITVDSLFTTDSTPVLTGTVNDPTAAINVTVNGHGYIGVNGGAGTWTAQVTHHITDGHYNVVATATDAASNVGSDSTINELTVDAHLPGAPILLIPTNNLYTSNYTTSFLWIGPFFPAHGPVTYSLQVATDSGFTNIVVDNDSGFLFQGHHLADGVYYSRVMATDTLGGTSGWSNIRKFTVDTVDPTVSITAPADSSDVNGTISLEGTTSDLHPDTYRWTIKDAGNNTVYTHLYHQDSVSPYNWDTTTVVDGTYTIYLKATDDADNNRTTSVQVTIDNTAPAVAITSPASLIGHDAVVTVNGTTDDAVSYELYIDGVLVEADATPFDGFAWDTTGLESRDYLIELRAVDALGNEGGDSLTVTVDNTAPVIVYTGFGQVDNVITPEVTITGQDSFSWLAADTNPAGASFDGSLIAPSFTVTNTGNYSFTLTALDEFGNVDTFVFSFSYTAPAPASQPTEPAFTNVQTTGGEEVLGEQTDQSTTTEGASTTTDQAVTGANDDKGGVWKIIGLAWYWWLLILAALAAIIWWIIGAIRRRGQENA